MGRGTTTVFSRNVGNQHHSDAAPCPIIEGNNCYITAEVKKKKKEKKKRKLMLLFELFASGEPSSVA